MYYPSLIKLELMWFLCSPTGVLFHNTPESTVFPLGRSHSDSSVQCPSQPLTALVQLTPVTRPGH